MVGLVITNLEKTVMEHVLKMNERHLYYDKDHKAYVDDGSILMKLEKHEYLALKRVMEKLEDLSEWTDNTKEVK